MTADPDFLPVLISPFVGSFIGVVVSRSRTPRRIVIGRSCCGSCGTTLSPLDLVPVASWAVSRGRCRHCSAAVSALYPGVELAALAIALWAAMVSSGPALWAGCILGWWLLALAGIDAHRFVLPDFLTLPLLAAGLAASALFWPQDFANVTAGAALGYAAMRLLRWGHSRLTGREGLGLGDAKLLAAAGAWVSWAALPSVVLIASVSALAFVMVQGLRRGSLIWQERIAFGTHLSLGIWLTWLYGPVPEWM